MRFIAPNGSIFVPGFFCQLAVTLLAKLNVSQKELVSVHSNCISVSCKGLFVGELIVTIEEDAKSFFTLMKATNPNLSIFSDIVSQLIASSFTQYEGSERQILCPTCVDLSYFQDEFPHESIGTIESKSTGRSDHAQFCTPRIHLIEYYCEPQPETAISTKCWSHNLSTHDHFLNNRVIVEGKKSVASSEGEGGFVEVVYLKLATTKKKNGDPVSLFRDKKCLNYGQDWEDGFLHGLQSSRVILLLVSNKVIEGIAKNAPSRQDNVLVEYPYFQYTLY